MQKTQKIQKIQPLKKGWLLPIAFAVGGVVAGASVAFAQILPSPLSLPAAFEQAWEHQPEARSMALRRSAADAARTAANRWTAEPIALALQSKIGRPGSNNDSREYEVGLSIPLWLPGERARKGALEEAEQKVVESQLAVTKLQFAALVREAWWNYQRAQGEWDLSKERLTSTQKLAADVARRFKVGALSKADLYQAHSAVAQMEATSAEALGVRDAALSGLNGLVGMVSMVGLGKGRGFPDSAEDFENFENLSRAEPMVDALQAPSTPLQHPVLTHLEQQSIAARKAAHLVALQTRANPELTVATTRSKGQSGEAYQQLFTVGVRVPLGSPPNAQAKQTLAEAEAIEAELRVGIARFRLVAGIHAATAHFKALQSQLGAMTKNAELARQTRAFYEKSFRLGEADFPTRLRVEQESTQAERQLARTRTDAAAAISSLRQAWGLLPENPTSEPK